MFRPRWNGIQSCYKSWVASFFPLVIDVSKYSDTSWNHMRHPPMNTFMTHTCWIMSTTQKCQSLWLRNWEFSLQHHLVTIWSTFLEWMTCLTPRSNQCKWHLNKWEGTREMAAAEESNIRCCYACGEVVHLSLPCRNKEKVLATWKEINVAANKGTEK